MTRRSDQFMSGRGPVVVARGTPLPESQRTPLYAFGTTVYGQALTPTPRLVGLRMALKAARRKLAEAESWRDRDWDDFSKGDATWPFNLKTIQAWRRANVRVIKLQLVEIPMAEMAARDPTFVMPASIPRPRDHWGYGT